MKIAIVNLKSNSSLKYINEGYYTGRTFLCKDELVGVFHLHTLKAEIYKDEKTARKVLNRLAKEVVNADKNSLHIVDLDNR